MGKCMYCLGRPFVFVSCPADECRATLGVSQGICHPSSALSSTLHLPICVRCSPSVSSNTHSSLLSFDPSLCPFSFMSRLLTHVKGSALNLKFKSLKTKQNFKLKCWMIEWFFYILHVPIYLTYSIWGIMLIITTNNFCLSLFFFKNVKIKITVSYFQWK